ncbi:hypothetical protein LTS14_003606, partial [Recurvomyces mirabilis]
MDEENVVGVGRCGVNMADCWGGNIDIGNQDWMDLKEEEVDLWDGEDPYDDDGEGGDAGDDDEAKATKQAPSTARSGTSSAAGAGKMTYGWYSLVFKAVPISEMLEPDWLKMKPSASRFQLLGNYNKSSDPWSEIREAHPLNCVARPKAHRTLILVAQQETADQADAMVVVRLKWDGDTSVIDEDADPPENESQALKPEIEVLRK